MGTQNFAAPKLLVVVDTEEEFDWEQPFSRRATDVSHMRYLDRAQQIFQRYAIKPTYVIDYSIASQEQGYRPLREWLDAGLCTIGAHLHPWVNPPHDEELCAYNSYPGNLPKALERAKLACLTEVIERNIGRRPIVYRAGRYGMGASTGEILEELGYVVDTSVVPRTAFRDDGGPDFTAFDNRPFWFGPSSGVLEIPLTVGWCGRLKSRGDALQPFLMSRLGSRLRLRALFARLGLFERIRLTPEGNDFSEMKRLTDTMLAAGTRLFVFSYHSPSVVPGNTPYVRNEGDLRRFLGLIDKFCEYFVEICSGEGITPEEARTLFANSEPHAGVEVSSVSGQGIGDSLLSGDRGPAVIGAAPHPIEFAR